MTRGDDVGDKLPAFLTRDGEVVRITGTPYLWADFAAHADKSRAELSDLFPALTLGTLDAFREWLKANPTAE